MAMRRKTNGGAHFAAKRETEAKASRFFSTQPSSSSQSTQTTNILTQTCVDKDDNKEDDDEDDSKVEFFLKVGKHKKFKFF